MIRFILVISILVTVVIKSFSQQPDIAHFISQPLEVNPAYAGSYNQYRGNIYYRSQWIGFEDHPETFRISGELPIEKMNSGMGLLFNSDKNGPIKSKIFRYSYSYILNFNKINIQFGAGINYARSKFELSSWITPESYDPLISSYDKNFNQLSVSGGMFLYNDKLYFSLSYNDLNLYNNYEEGMITRSYLNLIYGYHFLKGNKVSFNPALLMRLNPKYGNLLELNLTAILFNKLWLSSVYNTYNDIKIKIGIDIWKCHGGLSYSNNLDNIGGFTDTQYGMFEIFTGFYFYKK